jgi:hypothetical protein
MSEHIVIEEVRKVVTLEDGNLQMNWRQVQQYTPEQVKNMLDAWEHEKQEKETWLATFDDKVKAGEDMLHQQMNAMKQKIEQDLVHINEGIALWSNPEPNVEGPDN